MTFEVRVGGSVFRHEAIPHCVVSFVAVVCGFDLAPDRNREDTVSCRR